MGAWRGQIWYPVIRAHGVHMGLCGPVENPSREPIEEASCGLSGTK
jgi:hypothetical protein